MAAELGSTGDIAARLRAALPLHWFADDAPVLGAVLDGLGAGWARLYDMLQFVRRQSRIGSAEGAMLDMVATDFFGAWLGRRPGQGDDPFRAAVLRELLRERATRAGLAAALADLTGRPPDIFEPSRPADTGAWGIALGYNAAGGYGSLALPFQCFVRVRRPTGAGIANVAGYEWLRGDGLIDARATTTRSTGASYFDATGTLQVAAPGVARIDWTTGAPLLLSEGASANQVRNPRFEGASVGTPGIAPASMSLGGINGLSSSIVGTGSESGIPYLDFRIFGTATGAGNWGLQIESPTQIAAAAGQTWTVSAYARLVAGALGNPATGPRLQIIENNAGGGYASGGSGPALALTNAPLRTQYTTFTRTLAGGTTAYVMPAFGGGYAVGAVVDFTLRIGAPQIEQAASASSAMLPPAGSPGVATRSAETIAIPATLPGGYGAGAIEYASADMVQGQVTDADIYAAAARAMPAAAIAWTAISS